MYENHYTNIYKKIFNISFLLSSEKSVEAIRVLAHQYSNTNTKLEWNTNSNTSMNFHTNTNTWLFLIPILEEYLEMSTNARRFTDTDTDI